METFIADHAEHISPEDKIHLATKKTCANWISLFNGSKKMYSDNRGGDRGQKKITEEIDKALILTLWDFPSRNGEQRRLYLNKYGPCKNNPVSLGFVNDRISRLQFSVKTLKHQPPERNTIGLRVLRYIWSKLIIDYIKTDNTLFVFIDQTALFLVLGVHLLEPLQWMCSTVEVLKIPFLPQ